MNSDLEPIERTRGRADFLGRRGESALHNRCVRPGAALVLFVLAVWLPLLRQTGNHAWRVIFAEDGAIFFQEAHDHGPLSVMFRGYAGYSQLPPRILGAVSTLAPIGQLAVWLAVSATIVCACLAWFTYSFSQGWIPSRVVRLALATLVILMPAMGYENTATITNTIWSFVAVAPWALISLAERRRDVVVRSIVAFLAATSSALSVCFLPLAVGCLVWRRTRAALIVTSVFAAGLVVQAAVALNTRNASPVGVMHRSVVRLADLVGIRVFAEFLVGDKAIGALWSVAARSLCVAAPVIFALAFATLLPRADRRHRVVAAVLAVYAVLLFVVPVWGRGTNIVLSSGESAAAFLGRTLGPVSSHHGQSYVSSAMRYSVVPVFLLASALAVLVGSTSSRSGAVVRVARPIFVAHVVAMVAIGFSVDGARAGRLDWSTSVTRAYAASCVGRDPDTRVAVPTEPGFFAEFPVILRCRELKE